MGTLYGKGIAECIYPQLLHKKEEDPEKVKVKSDFCAGGNFVLENSKTVFSNWMKNFNF